MSMTIQLSENTNGHTTLGPIPTHRNIRKVPSFRVSASASTLGWQRGSIQCKLALRYTVSVQKVSQMSLVTHYSKLKQFACSRRLQAPYLLRQIRPIRSFTASDWSLTNSHIRAFRSRAAQDPGSGSAQTRGDIIGLFQVLKERLQNVSISHYVTECLPDHRLFHDRPFNHHLV